MRRKFDPTACLLVLEQLSKLVDAGDISLYESYEELARTRISFRDANDWAHRRHFPASGLSDLDRRPGTNEATIYMGVRPTYRCATNLVRRSKEAALVPDCLRNHKAGAP